MTQEIQILVRLYFSSAKKEIEIRRFFFDMDCTYTEIVKPKNRIPFPEIPIVEVKRINYESGYANVTLTLQADAEKSKRDIRDFFEDMEQTYTQNVTSKNRWEFTKIELLRIREEAEIYGNA